MRGFIDAFGQIGRHCKPARCVANGRRHHIRQRQTAETCKCFTPGAQIAWHGDRKRADDIGAARRFEIHRIGRFGGREHIGARGGRRSGQPINHRVPPIGQAQMRHAAAQNANHHGLHHRQREQRSDGAIHCIAAGSEHLGPRSGGERMVRHHHAARARGGALFRGKTRTSA